MSISSLLYQLLIGPLQLFFEILYSVAYRMIGNPGLSIVVLSLCMNFLVLPLYRRADAMQAEERELEMRLQPWIDHIKKSFKGDERYMILQTYYRQNNYKPTDALKGSLSLLLQVPFFIAAYHFLSGLALLHGVSFGPIRDLGAPDAMFVVAGFTVNVLPILMTLINVISGMVYTRGMPLKSKVQLYAMAGLFLVLLYRSPAGLVMYWTLNNLFSLVKNLFGKLEHPAFVVGCIASLGGLGILVRVLLRPMGSTRHQVFALLLVLLLQLPLALHFVMKKLSRKETAPLSATEQWIFRLGCLFLTILLGALIPSAVLVASPQEFINIYAYRSPLLYILHTLILAAGTFLIWFNVFYALSETGGKRGMTALVWTLCGCGLVNYMFFGTNLGTISNKLQFHEKLHFSLKAQLLNLVVVIVVAAILLLIYKLRTRAVSFVLLVSSLAVLGMSGVNAVQINTQVEAAKANIEATEGKQALPLTKNGQNVLVIVLDRGLGAMFPYLIHERPELKEQFSGFTFYPNTISHGGYTNFGKPELYGGYEYTTLASNRRDDVTLGEKHDEALKLMPTIFGEAGYQVTITDPTYAGYSHVPDLSIFDDVPNTNAIITRNRYGADVQEKQQEIDAQLDRNFFCYSLMKVSPLAAQGALYQKGNYNNSASQNTNGKEGDEDDSFVQEITGLSRAEGINEEFMEWYPVLEHLKDLTEVQEDGPNSLILFNNESPHEPTLLQLPDYTVESSVDNTEYDGKTPTRSTDDGKTITFTDENQMMHYHANMASMLRIGEWMDYLKEQGVYDNTRIIIVADHGRKLKLFDDMVFYDGELDALFYNPLLLVKDFNAEGEPKTDNSFMTNADTPTLATEGLIDNPVNPFTGKAINSDAKEGKQYILVSKQWNIDKNNGNTFLPDPWVSVHDNIFEEKNWTLNEKPKQ